MILNYSNTNVTIKYDTWTDMGFCTPSSILSLEVKSQNRYELDVSFCTLSSTSRKNRKTDASVSIVVVKMVRQQMLLKRWLLRVYCLCLLIQISIIRVPLRVVNTTTVLYAANSRAKQHRVGNNSDQVVNRSK